MSLRRTTALVGAAVLAGAGLAGAATASGSGATGVTSQMTATVLDSLPQVRSVAHAERLAARAGVAGTTMTIVQHADGFKSTTELFTADGTVHDETHGDVIGHFFFQCNRAQSTVKPAPNTWCENATELTGRGKLLMTQPLSPRWLDTAGPNTVVLGGTGEFSGAQGEATVSVMDSGHVFDLIIVIELL